MKGKKIFNIVITLIIFLTGIYKIFFYIDIKNGCSIVTIPTYLPSNTSTKEIIKLIKRASPDDYKMLCDDVNVINKNISCGGFDGGCYESHQEKTLFLGNDQNNISLAGAIVVHELCHREQGKENRPFLEQECYAKGYEFLNNVVVY